jgi:hypothetical protein
MANCCHLSAGVTTPLSYFPPEHPPAWDYVTPHPPVQITNSWPLCSKLSYQPGTLVTYLVNSLISFYCLGLWASQLRRYWMWVITTNVGKYVTYLVATK